MILARAPLRISFAGGGSDLPAFYEHETGAVFSAAITAYMHIAVTHKFDGKVRLGYSKTENVEAASELQHDIARETLKYAGVDRAVEVVSIADVPAGTGLGSSSAYTVALLQALYAFRKDGTDRYALARNACEIEIEKCHHPIGRQDQYASAFGGARLYEFHADGVQVHPGIADSGLADCLMLVYTGRGRDANGMLAKQPMDRGLVREMAELARVLAVAAERREYDAFARGMEAAWRLKRRIAEVDPEVDNLLEIPKRHGALAGKLCGAGGCGFLLLFVPPDCRAQMQTVMNAHRLRELRFRFDDIGARAVYAD